MPKTPTLYDIANVGNPLAAILIAKQRIQAACDRIVAAVVPEPLPPLPLPQIEDASLYRPDGWGIAINRYDRKFSVALTTGRTQGSVESYFIAQLTPAQIVAVTEASEALAVKIEALADNQERLAATAIERALAEYDPALRALAQRAATDRLQKDAAEADKLTWIATHGSERLRRLVKENIEYGGVYFAERLVHDRPNWRVWDNIPGDEHDPRNATDNALDLLDEARKIEPKARLIYVTVDRNDAAPDDENESKYAWTGYAALAEFLGRVIVFGGPPA